MHCSAIAVLAAVVCEYPFLGTFCSSVLSPNHNPAVLVGCCGTMDLPSTEVQQLQQGWDVRDRAGNLDFSC